ncbi:FGGY family carbohydrate kinase [Propionimicrobium sp. PCR01-08-3]|uniref:FGGY-family carbohydrate kinase n=1 Tax=Propionimicrobium sp. PCR01-08-3 TaxID=3052086 RepID=UPI00255CBC4A|nr:FGGY family carbohydrate kinase [Propionimicrobium sp. PCR01-08-3]WIY83354.1 FGGY family carbohydrate kinase [Propionimicrobium sp. PCR01-08-3]
MFAAVIGIDVGTSSTKGVLSGLNGSVLATATRQHDVQRPHPGHVEMAPDIWWQEFCSLGRELTSAQPEAQVVAVGVSGMGPCVALADEHSAPVRPAILYGVDTRAVDEIAEWTTKLGGDNAIIARCGSILTTQAAGPKIAWIARHEQAVYTRAKRLFMPASWLVWKLTGAYLLDHQSASQCTPMYDIEAQTWYRPWADQIATGIDLPRLAWAGEIAGTVTPAAAEASGLPAGIPVTCGTIDAWAEALSVDAHNVGDLMLMYGTTMFFINTVSEPVRTPALWGTIGALPGTRNVAGGMATSGAITNWLRDLFGSPGFSELVTEADAAGPGAHGLLMLPYFAGERTPLMDPAARGVLAGLTIDHTRGDLYRAALEATGLAVRHNIEAIESAGGRIDRIVAVGGGTKGDVWTQIVSDISGRPQVIPQETIGASYGSAWLAANLIQPIAASEWNPPARVLHPRPENAANYEELNDLYRQLYPATATVAHALARRQEAAGSRPE